MEMAANAVGMGAGATAATSTTTADPPSVHGRGARTPLGANPIFISNNSLYEH